MARATTLFAAVCAALAASHVIAGTEPAQGRDVTSLVRVEKSGFRRDLTTGEVVQTISVVNVSGARIPGRLYLVVDRAEAEAGTAGTRSTAADPISAAPLLSDDRDATGLSSGGHLTAVLRFQAGSNTARSYNVRVFQQQ